mgnify:CR=1 FL=1
MTRFQHNEQWFDVVPGPNGWDVQRLSTTGPAAVVGTSLFAGASADQALALARALVAEVQPVGVRLVPPDLSHSIRAGDLRIVPPDVAHPNFIRWTTDSTSFRKQS